MHRTSLDGECYAEFAVQVKRADDAHEPRCIHPNRVLVKRHLSLLDGACTPCNVKPESELQSYIRRAESGISVAPFVHLTGRT